jgi:glycerol-3-phosphate acyltransferase PlsY
VTAILAIAVGYVFGSIPASYLLARWFAGVDLRNVGSGNVGASNVLRVAGPGAYAAAILLDVGKGAGAVLLARFLGASGVVQVLGGVATVVGHMVPFWLRFKGGKGVATTVGVFGALTPLATLCVAVLWMAVVLLTRYASVASLAAVGALPFVLLVVHSTARPELLLLSLVLLVAVVYRHRSNLVRLRAGQERKLTWKRRGAPS